MRMSACIQERGCEMLEEDAGMHISFVYLLDSVWREYKYIYLGLYCCPHNSLSSTSLKYWYYVRP